MSIVVMAFGAILALGGVISIFLGYGMINVERGWTQVIAGATVLSGGSITLALGLILQRMEGLRAAVDSILVEDGPAMPQPLPVAPPAESLPQTESVQTSVVESDGMSLRTGAGALTAGAAAIVSGTAAIASRVKAPAAPVVVAEAPPPPPPAPRSLSDIADPDSALIGLEPTKADVGMQMSEAAFGLEAPEVEDVPQEPAMEKAPKKSLFDELLAFGQPRKPEPVEVTVAHIELPLELALPSAAPLPPELPEMAALEPVQSDDVIKDFRAVDEPLPEDWLEKAMANLDALDEADKIKAEQAARIDDAASLAMSGIAADLLPAHHDVLEPAQLQASAGHASHASENFPPPPPPTPAPVVPPPPPPVAPAAVSPPPLAAHVHEEPEAAAHQPQLESAVIGRYTAAGTSYVMFADGSIEAESPSGIFRFKSMADLKAFIENKS
jgi:hypothetical protein